MTTKWSKLESSWHDYTIVDELLITSTLTLQISQYDKQIEHDRDHDGDDNDDDDDTHA